MSETTLLEEVGPNGNVQAVVEAVDDVCYFYLFGAEGTNFETKSVWVRNLTAAPKSLDRNRMRAGKPPLNPAGNCNHPDGLALPDKEKLEIVWLPEGNGAALCEDDEILAIIPPWSGYEGFRGFARDAVGDGPLAWELDEDNVLIERLAKAHEFWSAWQDENLWGAIQRDLMSRIEKKLGKHSKYYGIDGDNWPPKAMLRINRSDSVVLITVGVSIRPQPNVEMATETPEELRRIELGAILPPSWSDKDVKKFGQYLSAQSDFPWTQYTWLGPGHTIGCDCWQNRSFNSALLQYEHANAPRLQLGTQFGDPVNVLWFLAITADERQIAVDQGSGRLLQQLPNDRWKDA